MAENKKKQDVLKAILNGSEDNFVPGLEELEKLIHRSVKPPEAAPVMKKPRTKREKRPKKRKTTYYLAEEVFENLGDAKEIIRKMLPDIQKSKISKTRIVNSALKMILKEFETKGGDSALVKQISKRDPKS
jgi:NADH dehydrogenase/NADH:ubiquinone oxidoreductase subunit G